VVNAGLDIGPRLSGLRQISRRSTREDLLNVFTPNEPIKNPSKFVGRQQALEAMINTLLTQGAHAAVFGERGCGKSSLATMLFSVAQGKLDILDYYGLRQGLERRGFLSFLIGSRPKKFTTIWVDGFNKTVDEVIHAILTRRTERFDGGTYGPGLLAYLPTEADQIEVASKIGFDKVFIAQDEVKEVIVPEKPTNIKEGIEIAVQRYSQEHGEEIIIIIDEFETVQNKADMAQYLKSLKGVHFFLVGIAQSAIELGGGHPSIARDLHGILLPPMSDEELRFILQIGSYILSPVCTFSDQAMSEVVNHSHGAPYWCHFLGKVLVEREIEAEGSFESFLNAPTGRIIGDEKVKPLLESLPQRPDCSIYEQQLDEITMEDERIAKVLLEIAKVDRSIINSPVVYRAIEQHSEITQDVAREIIDDIIAMTTSPLELRRRSLDTVTFSFRDPNFKRYILMRNAGLPSG
jgi:ABC-type dipeptide/oligopeptide/nickel transport system ATPase component